MRTSILLFSVGLLVADGAGAQPVPQAPGEVITVTGQRSSKQEIDEFVRDLTPVQFGGQMTRFEHSVCPAVIGLPQAQANAVAARMRLVASSVGITVAGPKCAPNILVVATSNKRELLRQIAQHRSDYFDSGHQEREVERQPGPAAAWGVGGPPISARGVDLYVDPQIGLYMNRTTEGSSRITEPVRPQFDAAVVVVEKKALVGMTTTQLADYASIRALTGADPAKLGSSSPPSILRVLDVPVGGEAPITMTNWDFAFLHGYYDARPVLRTGARRSAIVDSMDKDLHTTRTK